MFPGQHQRECPLEALSGQEAPQWLGVSEPTCTSDIKGHRRAEAEFTIPTAHGGEGGNPGWELRGQGSSLIAAPLMSGDLSRVTSLLYFGFLMRERGAVIAKPSASEGRGERTPRAETGERLGTNIEPTRPEFDD